MYYLSNQCITFPKLAMSYVFIINGWRTQYSGAAEGHLYISGKVGGGDYSFGGQKRMGPGEDGFSRCHGKVCLFPWQSKWRLTPFLKAGRSYVASLSPTEHGDELSGMMLLDIVLLGCRVTGRGRQDYPLERGMVRHLFEQENSGNVAWRPRHVTPESEKQRGNIHSQWYLRLEQTWTIPIAIRDIRACVKQGTVLLHILSIWIHKW